MIGHDSRTDGGPRPLPRPILFAYLAAFASVLIIGLVTGNAGERFVGITSGLLGAAAICVGVIRMRPRRAGAWLLLATGVLVLSVTESALGFALTFNSRYPTFVEIAFVVAYLPLAVSILWIGHPPSPRQHLPAVLDTAILSTAGTLIVWITLLQPALQRLDLTDTGRALLILDWVGDVALISMGILMVLTWRVNRAAVLLGIALFALMTADGLQSQALLDRHPRASAADLGFLAFCALCGLAAMDPDMSRITSVGVEPEHLGVWRMAALAVALLIPPSALLAETSPGPIRASVAISIVGAATGLLMLGRVAVGVIALRERTARERILRQAASDLGGATRTDDVVTSVSSAVSAMIGGRKVTVSLHPPDPALTSTRQIGEADNTTGFIRIPISTVTLVHTGVTQRLGEVRIRGPAPQLFHVDTALTSIADQAATALARVSLADAVRDHERENYFRTLVQNSSDVILICRYGKIAYATPSARELFARTDLIGLPVSQLIPVPEAPTAHGGQAIEAVVEGSDGPRRVLVHQRDLTLDETIHGIVLTLHDVTAQRQLTDELEYRASHDALTGLANGQLFREELRRAGQEATGEDICAALFVDLDNFKEVNDTLGHDAGDELLKVTAERIQGCLRRDFDLAARLGGDEFAVLLRRLHTVAAARDVAARLVSAFEQPIQIRGVGVSCSVSVGLADATSPDAYATVLKRADAALYAAKAAGKNAWREYRPNLPSSPQGQGGPPALSDQIRLAYQPIIDLKTRQPVGYEALTRVSHRSTPPAEFIAEAEQSGLIVAVGDWVLDRALTDMPALTSGTDRYVSVNVSPIQLRQGGFAEQVMARLHDAQVDPSRLMLELTEQLPLDARSPGWDDLAVLHDAGVRIALDDYGTGYSSLSYLRHHEIDVVKLDQSFLNNPDDSRHRALLDIIVDGAARLGIELIAEGIETARSLEVARQAGFRFGQGLYFAAAMPVEGAARYTGPAEVG